MLLVTSARLGEARGYWRMFLAGLTGFTLASALINAALAVTALAAAAMAALSVRSRPAGPR